MWSYCSASQRSSNRSFPNRSFGTILKTTRSYSPLFKVARIEVDHNTSRLRSLLMACVESVPPRRYLRLARNAGVNLGSAKNGLMGGGDAGTILATRRPRSVTYTSPADARLTHLPVA